MTINPHIGRFAVYAAISGFLAVALGAFGAHALKGSLSIYAQGVYNTAVQYQMYHSLALAYAALPGRGLHGVWQRRACWSFTLGMLLFSGSLYALALSGMRWLGAITPLGGLAFLIGWASLAMGLWRSDKAMAAEPGEDL